MKIGVIGGGQLGRMLALAGTPLGMHFAFLDPAPDACAAALGEHIRADYSDLQHLRQLADEVDLVTFEFESVPAETVAFLGLDHHHLHGHGTGGAGVTQAQVLGPGAQQHGLAVAARR